MADDFTFEIQNHLGAISETKGGWKTLYSHQPNCLRWCLHSDLLQGRQLSGSGIQAAFWGFLGNFPFRVGGFCRTFVSCSTQAVRASAKAEKRDGADLQRRFLGSRQRKGR